MRYCLDRISNWYFEIALWLAGALELDIDSLRALASISLKTILRLATFGTIMKTLLRCVPNSAYSEWFWNCLKSKVAVKLLPRLPRYSSVWINVDLKTSSSHGKHSKLWRFEGNIIPSTPSKSVHANSGSDCRKLCSWNMQHDSCSYRQSHSRNENPHSDLSFSFQSNSVQAHDFSSTVFGTPKMELKVSRRVSFSNQNSHVIFTVTAIFISDIFINEKMTHPIKN